MFENKNIVVTGANGFLGSEIVKKLHNLGANCISVDNFSKHCDDYVVDISDSKQVSQLSHDIKRKFCEIFGIVNNAAVSFKGKHISYDQFNKTLLVNISGTYNFITEFQSLLANNARIVNISSIYGVLSPNFELYKDNELLYNSSAYSASKAAIIQLTKYYAVQLAPIRVNCVSPGGIFNGHDESFVSNYSKNVPLKRMANVDEIVDPIIFLLSDQSNYITGQNILVDGGLSVL